MRIYLAGGITGNLFPEWRKVAEGRKEGRKEGRNVYLAGEHPVKNGSFAKGGGYILESYYYCKDNPVVMELLPTLDGFLLDSGAFTFMQGNGQSCDWDRYTEGYAEWINRHNVDLFFELDIDSIVGLKEVERLRAKLERLTGKQPIPVWHNSRGKDYYLGMIKDYKYCALGGIVGKARTKSNRILYERMFPWFINQAHANNCKLHGLGYTSIAGLKTNHFDSVDSTAWLYGNRGGYLYIFNPKTGNFNKVNTPPGYRLKSRESALFNFMEWRKFQEYAKLYL